MELLDSKLHSSCAILWDLDGTICDTHDLALTSTNIVLTTNGYPPITDIDYKNGSKFPTPQRLAWHACGDENDSIGIRLGEEFDRHYVPLVSPENTQLYVGVRELLDKYQNFQMGVLSNACGDYVRAVISVNNLNKYFKVQNGADDVEYPKPHPHGLIKMCEQLHVSPHNCIYIGDGPHDAEAAKSAHLHSIGVLWGFNSIEQINNKFDTIVTNINELDIEIHNFIHNKTHYNSIESIISTKQHHTDKKRVKWTNDVVDNEHLNKLRTDNEVWPKEEEW
jgi:HAD superfamily hydrolase (TIGR01549 family)